MTVVPDTNVLVSALLAPNSIPATVASYWQNYIVSVALSEEILSEYNDVLYRYKFMSKTHLNNEIITEFLDDLREYATLIDVKHEVDIAVEDESDKKFLACAVDAGADYVVTGDTKHLLPIKAYKNIPIITPRECIEAIDSQKVA